ncbi:firmicute fructose-1,6-bisphosphatase [Prevotella disiens JCM 6334 = ATCC 29426]|uniref:Fructose-1,6-bisphosphatase class 3 n=2 Tax=Prevotella disiens TaxID=28130 RepID=A0A379EFA3_9BACT|nr:fructose-bisphosphatase class III [Prevotella disiens]ERJ72026.1 firmicute fructose-1,6-bisphosphatase [Prevotella disiens JCM 6334 = ATCC 29426]SUB97588.1 Fructose-1,6-bisphosphatase class 3 [Prevotella disiens]
MTSKTYDLKKDERYLQLLSQSFPTIADASTEIINLQAILNLPKGTEHFLADIHGEHEAFQHVLKNASGNIKRKVNDLFGNTLRESEKRDLCTLIYYPEQKLELVKQEEKELDDWYHIQIHRLVKICRDVSSKYTRSKVRKSLPVDFSYIIQELLHENSNDKDKTDYVSAITSTIISTGRADDFIETICNVIQRLAIDHLHIMGDIYDRGPGAHAVMDTLKNYHTWDITWGNHDILWMGACAGNNACICNVIRIALRYDNMDTIEDGYGINLMQLATFAMETYKNDPCAEFMPKIMQPDAIDEKSIQLIAQMHKAISIIQFKVESQMIKKYPHWKMDGRLLYDKIDYKKGTIKIDGKEYQLTSCNFPTIDPKNPDVLTPEEQALMEKLHHNFTVSEKLREHILLLLRHGCMYKVVNNNLLYHASIPLNEDGTLREVEITPKKIAKGKDLLNKIGTIIRRAFQNNGAECDKDMQYATDYFLYLWCGPNSPLFDKHAMTTFERYFLKEKETHHEEKGFYFKFREREDIADTIMEEFGVNSAKGHIINGHVPVHVNKGESPIKANGKLMVIDGGFSQAYHKETGIAGYTLVYHSRGFELVQHEPFSSEEDAIKRGIDIVGTTQIVELNEKRLKVADMDKGTELKMQIEALQELLYAYRHGFLSESEKKNPPKL